MYEMTACKIISEKLRQKGINTYDRKFEHIIDMTGEDYKNVQS